MDCCFLKEVLPETKVDRPTGGTLSGHAAGEPFDKCVEELLKDHYPNKALRQYEYLNALYLSKRKATTAKLRHELIKDEVARFFLSRGDSATQKWSAAHPFTEKQDDTADILLINRSDVTSASKFCLVDVKTKNLAKSAQAPNIISAYKLAKACKLILENPEQDCGVSLTYVGVDWIESGRRKLVCKAVHIKSLFKAPPKFLYINWAAGMQIQFHVSELTQTYSGNTKEWSREFLRYYVRSAKKRIDYMRQNYIAPFKPPFPDNAI
jgi:hypothetical protein